MEYPGCAPVRLPSAGRGGSCTGEEGGRRRLRSGAGRGQEGGQLVCRGLAGGGSWSWEVFAGSWGEEEQKVG